MSNEMSKLHTPLLTERFEKAFSFAYWLHQKQVRKGTTVPYISHLLGVTALVLESGGSEDEAIAALLHDAVEDQGGLSTLELIQEKFGENVAKLVAACSDTLASLKSSWKERKKAFLDCLEEATPQVMRIVIADKLHNSRCTLTDLQDYGPEIWERFNATPEERLWFYKSIIELAKRKFPSSQVQQLASVVEKIERITNEKMI
jgi:(p)ppGpp synthase/HD superfamily hydrolase